MFIIRYVNVSLFLIMAVFRSDSYDVQNEQEVKKGLEKLNEYRKLTGLEPVELDLERTKGCKAHAEYLIKYGSGKSPHSEDKNSPGYTEEGAKVAPISVIAFIKPPTDVDRFMASFYHRMPLIHTQVKHVGYGCATNGSKWASVIECYSGLRPSKKEDPEFVLYPAVDQKNVPLGFSTEVPSPLPKDHKGSAGHPVTISFFKNQKIKDVKTLFKDEEKEIECYVSTPEKPAPAGSASQYNTICLIPKGALKSGIKYTVEVSCTVDGKEFTKKWSFTTKEK